MPPVHSKQTTGVSFTLIDEQHVLTPQYTFSGFTKCHGCYTYLTFLQLTIIEPVARVHETSYSTSGLWLLAILVWEAIITMCNTHKTE